MTPLHLKIEQAQVALKFLPYIKGTQQEGCLKETDSIRGCRGGKCSQWGCIRLGVTANGSLFISGPTRMSSFLWPK